METLCEQLEKVAGGRNYRSALACGAISVISFLPTLWFDSQIVRVPLLIIAILHFVAGLIFAAILMVEFVKTVLTFGYPRTQQKDEDDDA